jgi:hypothetical protein
VSCQFERFHAPIETDSQCDPTGLGGVEFYPWQIDIGPSPRLAPLD